MKTTEGTSNENIKTTLRREDKRSGNGKGEDKRKAVRMFLDEGRGGGELYGG